MVVLKTSKELSDMKLSCKISAQALRLAGELIRPGVSTAYVDKMLHEFILSQGARPTFLGYGGFPASAWHLHQQRGDPRNPFRRTDHPGRRYCQRRCGAAINGYTGDNAATFAAGRISGEAQKIMDVTKECLCRAIQAAQPGNRLGDIGHAVQSCAESYGFAVVRDYVGHGVGRKLHEDPAIPNYGTQGHGLKLLPGMTLAIEPMINIKGSAVVVRPDGTVLTKSGKPFGSF